MNCISGYFLRGSASKETSVYNFDRMKGILFDRKMYGAEWSAGTAFFAQDWACCNNIDCSLRLSNSSCKPTVDSSSDIVFVAAGRIDNAIELQVQLNLKVKEGCRREVYQLMKEAYLKWGEDCSERMYGDWAFAAWHPKEQRMILSRDHHGSTSLYYYIDNNIFAFASTQRVLLDLKLPNDKLNELYLAQYLTGWTSYHNDTTLHANILRLPPAHCMRVDKVTCYSWCYWHLENTPELNYSRREEYVENFLNIFDEAIRTRITNASKIAVTLSSGLDSGSIAATAARLIDKNRQQLIAFTSVPLYETKKYIKNHIGNEYTLANEVAKFANITEHIQIDSLDVSPIEAIKSILKLKCDPCRGAGNLFWMTAMYQAAAARGCSIMLIGALGNGSMSWMGSEYSQPISYWLSHKSVYDLSLLGFNFLKQNIRSCIPKKLLFLKYKCSDSYKWYRKSAININFANRLNLSEQLFHFNESCDRTPKNDRFKILHPGRYNGGAFDAEMASSYGLQITDPSADARILEFTLAIPDHIFIEPKSGVDRWLIRESMRGRLPERVRLNKRHGVQAGDRAKRICEFEAEILLSLEELEKGPAADYVDVSYMREVWEFIKCTESPDAHTMTGNILLRGIMAGLYVNNFYE
jgi:asparagine synthase (glutamine-hydrolysing)